ncbi:Spx/MgsR family RNA polymerase-binding regulatory protein [Sphingobacterium suaedae]|uniref:Spx/MgsR family RNA polymerase-binding regulatory protein n=1 Tax=Sphingobacterium suaedae TaxID=1686402 RepID=A0ABW5KGZ0_9SPHI
MIQVYGIKNCNTVKKALTWLDAHQVPYTFHDYKKEPASLEKLLHWEKEVSWEALVNKKGTTWKKLSPIEQAAVNHADAANEVLIQHNSMIKRPILETKKGLILGFNEDEYTSKLT